MKRKAGEKNASRGNARGSGDSGRRAGVLDLRRTYASHPGVRLTFWNHRALPAQGPLDPVTVALGRFAQNLTAVGEVDVELALSYAIWPTPEILRAVAEVDDVAA